jgi:hypothetical protein
MSISSKQLPDASRPTTVGIVAPSAALDALAPLRRAYARRGIGETVVVGDAPPAPGELVELASAVDAVLLVHPPKRSPRTVVPWPAAPVADGRRVPVGIVPGSGADLDRFAISAAAVHLRAIGEPAAATSVALLAQRSARYLDLAGRIRRLLAEHEVADDSVFWWPADEIVRDDVTAGLRLGLAVAVYVGHGRPRGWVGYAGVRAHHLDGTLTPGALVVSLACQTSSRYRTGRSFTEALVTQGTAAAAIGAVGTTRHIANARWSLRLVDALAAGAPTAGRVLVAAAPEGGLARNYRLIGDPVAPLLDAPGARAAARALSDDVIWNPANEEIPA